MQDEYNRFMETAPGAIRDGLDFLDYSHRHKVSPSYIGRYHDLQMQEELRRNPPPTPEEVELAKLEGEVTAAMGIIE